MISNKKGIGPVVASALLLVVAVVAVVGFQSWYGTYSSALFTKAESDSGSASTKVEGLVGADLYFRNAYAGKNITITGIELDGFACDITQTNITPSSVGTITLDSSCIGNVTQQRAEVLVITPDEIFTSYLFFSNVAASAAAATVTAGNLTMTFAAGTSCTGSTKLYGIDGVNESHSEVPGSTSFTTSACLNDTSGAYTLGTSCSGTYERLFYLGNTTNSHIWIDNSSAYTPYPGYYNWQEVCLSIDTGSPTLFDVTYNTSDMSGDDYICVGSYVQNDTYGGHMGNCALGSTAHENQIWVKLE